MAKDWDDRPIGPGVMGRLLVPQRGARPATTGFLLGVLAAIAFVVSLTLDWQQVTFTVPASEPSGFRLGQEYTVNAAAGDAETLSQAYIFGMVALLGLVGAVLMRPELALRLRMVVTGVGVGLLGVVVATALNFPASAVSGFSGMFGSTAVSGEIAESIKVSYQTGVAAAVAAILLATVAVWLAANPAVRALAGMTPPPLVPPVETAPPPSDPIRPGHVDELSVSVSEPVDLSTTPDTWRR